MRNTSQMVARAAAGAAAAAQSPTVATQVAPSYGRIYTTFNTATDVLPSIKEITSDTCWDDPDGFLTTFFTSSVELTYSSSNYYYNVYQNATSAASSSDPQFAIAYGNYSGSGGVTGSAAGYTGNLGASRTPTKAVYSQYANLLLQPGDENFSFGGTASNDIFVINFYRTRYREKLDPGNWELKIGTSTLIDNSGASGVTGNISPSGRVFNVVSGSILAGTASSTAVFGLCYPDVGIIILNPTALQANSGVTRSTAAYVAPASSNIKVLYNAIVTGASFQARTEENISSTYYFVRVGNMDFNYSNNPTFTTGSLGLIRYSLFHTDPRVYITSVGLYNDNNELLAIAKLSKPLLKSFTREALIRVKIDF